jgi:hypothetical protein
MSACAGRRKTYATHYAGVSVRRRREEEAGRKAEERKALFTMCLYVSRSVLLSNLSLNNGVDEGK